VVAQPATTQSAESVKVIVRCRPFIERELRAGEDKQAAVAIDKDLRQVSLLRADQHSDLSLETGRSNPVMTNC